MTRYFVGSEVGSRPFLLSQSDFRNRMRPSSRRFQAEISANAEKSARPQYVSANNSWDYKWRCHCNKYKRGTPDKAKMTLKIEKVTDGHSTTIRLIGRMRAEYLEELKAQIKDSGSRIGLDLEEVSLVDVDVVRFLGTCQAEGISLMHCPPYINDWIAKQRELKEEQKSNV